eukprot:12603451-Heterocapsa_arctica.AAC.1
MALKVAEGFRRCLHVCLSGLRASSLSPLERDVRPRLGFHPNLGLPLRPQGLRVRRIVLGPDIAPAAKRQKA